MSGYVSTVIILSVAVGTVTLTFSGFRLSGALKTLLSLIMTAAAFLPLISLAGEKDFEPPSVNYEAASVYEPYFDLCKEEIEKRLLSLLKTNYGEGAQGVALTLDASDISSVKINQVDLTLKESLACRESELEKTVRENTDCSKIIFNYTEE